MSGESKSLLGNEKGQTSDSWSASTVINWCARHKAVCGVVVLALLTGLSIGIYYATRHTDPGSPDILASSSSSMFSFSSSVFSSSSSSAFSSSSSSELFSSSSSSGMAPPADNSACLNISNIANFTANSSVSDCPRLCGDFFYNLVTYGTNINNNHTLAGECPSEASSPYANDTYNTWWVGGNSSIVFFGNLLGANISNAVDRALEFFNISGFTGEGRNIGTPDVLYCAYSETPGFPKSSPFYITSCEDLFFAGIFAVQYVNNSFDAAKDNFNYLVERATTTLNAVASQLPDSNTVASQFNKFCNFFSATRNAVAEQVGSVAEKVADIAATATAGFRPG